MQTKITTFVIIKRLLTSGKSLFSTSSPNISTVFISTRRLVLKEDIPRIMAKPLSLDNFYLLFSSGFQRFLFILIKNGAKQHPRSLTVLIPRSRNRSSLKGFDRSRPTEAGEPQLASQWGPVRAQRVRVGEAKRALPAIGLFSVQIRP